MLVTLTSRHWSDPVTATGLVRAVGALENSLGMDSPWRATGTSAASGSMPCCSAGSPSVTSPTSARSSTALRCSGRLIGAPASWSKSANCASPLMGTVDRPGFGPHLAPGSPIRAGEQVIERAPVLGEHTDVISSAWLGSARTRFRPVRAGRVRGERGDGPRIRAMQGRARPWADWRALRG
jgi:2-methylfumaryl-CoA isomerase